MGGGSVSHLIERLRGEWGDQGAIDPPDEVPAVQLEAANELERLGQKLRESGSIEVES